MDMRPANDKGFFDRLIDFGCDMAGYMLWIVAAVMIIGFLAGEVWNPGSPYGP